MKTPGIRRTTKGWEVSVTHEGRRKQAVCQSKGEARAKQKELQAMLFAKSSEPQQRKLNSDLTLGEAYKRSMKVRWANTKGAETVQCYLDKCCDFLGWTTKLTDLDSTDLAALQQHFMAAGNANATVNKKLNLIKSLFVDAKKDRLINVAAPMPKPLQEKNLRDEVFTREEERAFAEWFQQAGHPELADMFLFAIDTCARCGELRKLRAHDFTLYGKGKGSVTFEDRKANNLGSVPLTARAYAIARKYRSREGPLWNYSLKQVCELFNQAKAGVGLSHRTRLTFHCTRHSCASRLAAANVSLAMIMRYGGWSSLTSVKRYLHIQVDALDPCVQALEG